MKLHIIVTMLFAMLVGCGDNPGAIMNLDSDMKLLDDPAPVLAELGEPLTPYFEGETATLSVYEIDDVWLPKGKVAASDGTMFEVEAYTRAVPPGRYKVQLVVANFGDALKPNKRNAFAILRISNEPIVSWEMAVLPGQDLSNLSPGDVYGYPVGTGTGCFADPNAARAINAAMFTELAGPRSPAFIAMEKNAATTCDAVKVDTEQGSAILFSTGWGDGSYASYFGLDAQGKPAILVSDFQLLDWTNGFREEE